MKAQGKADDLDLRQFEGAFFEEAAEHLAEMERLLVRLDLATPTRDELDAIFRAAHSIKGGSGMFGFTDMTTLTHELESLLDRVRKDELRLSAAMVDVLLKSSDLLRDQLAFYSGQGPAPQVALEAMCAELRNCRRVDAMTAQVGTSADGGAGPASATGPRVLAITVPAGRGDPPLPPDLVEQLRALGELSEAPAAPAGARRKRKGAATLRTYRLLTQADAEVVLTLFEFVMDSSRVKVEDLSMPSTVDAALRTPPAQQTADAAPRTPPAQEAADAALWTPPAQPAAGAAEPPPAGADPGYGFFQPLAEPLGQTAPAPRPGGDAAQPKAEPRASDLGAAADTSIRVSVEKVDQLINQVGELVITQAMLVQSVAALDPVMHEKVLAGMADLERNTRDLQESVMSIRMLPIAFVFNRFPRLVRDLAAKLDKQVQLVTHGAGTELDKGLIERIADPLTHLVRNAIDHGIEPPEVRRAARKPPVGTITLRAAHQGGSILVEVADDGGGLDRERILATARARGLHSADTMTDAEVWSLIFEPGFSTAQAVSDVSGRGVGMDVVRRNIGALSGSVEIESMRGIGTRVTVRLPLTLAIMEGMSVAVGSEVYILPLASIVESLQVAEGQVHSIAGKGLVIDVRGEYLLVVSLHELFVNGPALGDRASGTMVIVEGEGGRVALLVDDLLGRHQVVVKSIEANYRKVCGISGATIMGDGRVALIVDVAALARARAQRWR